MTGYTLRFSFRRRCGQQHAREFDRGFIGGVALKQLFESATATLPVRKIQLNDFRGRRPAVHLEIAITVRLGCGYRGAEIGAKP
jgi:hypothetical protein